MVVNNEHIDENALPALLENFSLLRDKALEYIHQNSSAKWTDHNVHDPGITIMEALCYALSDLGFRMNFPMQDLLTDQNGNLPGKSFYYANEILPCHPVTINDFRKILIDLPQIKNAWIIPMTPEATGISPDYEPMYIYQEGGRLIIKRDITDPPVPAAHHAAILTSAPLFITGLYAINIEFETQPVLGNIDSGENFEAVYEPDFFGEIFYDISNWNELINNKLVLRKISAAYSTGDNGIALDFEVSSKNKYNNSDGKLDERVLKEWYYNITILHNTQPLFVFKDVLFQPYFESKKGIKNQDLQTLVKKNNHAFFGNCFKKIEFLSQAYTNIHTVLHRNRNLSEDFLPQLSAIPSVELRICADIDVETGADIEQVQAIIFHKVEEYLSPTIPFYTYDELAARGIPLEKILEGPSLNHGFILEEEMGADSFENFTINLSDIINAIYETDGLVNCRSVQIFLVDDDGHTITNGNKWVVTVPTGYKPVLNKRKSKLTYYKNELPLLAHFRESIIKLSLLQTNSLKYSNSNIPYPTLNQKYRNLAFHYSLADEFPATYKIGRNLPDEFAAKPEFYKSKQLEGYLLLFEQLIANFLKDLHMLRESLSWDTVSHLQFTSSGNEWRRSYMYQTGIDNKWQNIIEPPVDFLKKRNAGLDYLLSRFAENLQEADNYFYLTTDNLGIDQAEYYQSLIELKQKFLANYIAISANRGAAIDLYAAPSYFDTPVSGYENRLSRLLGCELISNGKRKRSTDVTSDKNERGYFHVLEHILLRIPAFSPAFLIYAQANNLPVTELPGICTDDDCTACGDSDPFSFTTTIVIPSWIAVYKDSHYRDFVEKRIRKETPVGVMLRICWLDQESMTKYETAIDAWWQERYKLFFSDADTYNDDLAAYLAVRNELIKVLKAQRSDYFPATLHGCEDEGEENNTRVFLDRTILG